MIDVFLHYLSTVPYGALISSPYGSFHRSNHAKRVIVYCDGDTFRAGGFHLLPTGTKVEFAFQKKVSPTQWFLDQYQQIPKSWRKEYVSFYAGSRIFSMSCVTSTLPSTTNVEVEFAPDHALAINIVRWAEANQINLHYASLSSLEMTHQWFATRENWAGDRELRFFLGHDGSQWFIAGANVNGLCAFHQIDSPYELGDNVNGFYVTLNPETLGQVAFFAPGREEEASSAVSHLKDNYFPDLQIDSDPYGPPPAGQAGADPQALKFLSALIPRRYPNG